MDGGVSMKCVFRQKTYVGEYKLEAKEKCITHYSGWETVFGWDIVKNEKAEEVSDEVIFACEIEHPQLKAGEKFFISKLNKSVTIKDKMRCDTGEIVYYIEDKVLPINEEVKENFMKEFGDKTIQEIEGLKDEINLLKETEKRFNKYKKEYKYKNRFFNFKKEK